MKSIQPPSNQSSQVKLKEALKPVQLKNRSNLRERNHSVHDKDDAQSQYSAGVKSSAHGYHLSQNQNSSYLSHAVATDNESARVSNQKAFKYNGPASNASGPYQIQKVHPHESDSILP